MSQMNPKEALHNTAYSVQLPYIAGRSPSHYAFKTKILTLYLRIKCLGLVFPCATTVYSKFVILLSIPRQSTICSGVGNCKLVNLCW